MPSTRLIRRGLGAALLCLVLAAPLAAQDTTATRTAAVTYLAGTSVYVGAGRDAGVAEGTLLTVFRGAATIATLKVVFLSSRQASCEVVSATGEIQLGDSVRYVPTAAAAVVAAGPARRRPRAFRGPGLHGRVGARYLVASEDPGNVGFTQPSADLRLMGQDLWGTSLGLAFDLRTRRTTRDRSTGPATVDGRTRVYQAALLWNSPGAPFRMGIGRQYLGAVTSVSLFDGVLTEFNGRHVTGAVFGGVEPEPLKLGFSSDVRDVGGYVQFHSAPMGVNRWQFTTGVVGSYQGGRSNREFAFGQASLSTRAVSLSALQEVDYYRPWKTEQGESSLSPTSTYLSGVLRAASWLSFRGSYDTRRRVRLYRDAVDPATAFDDSYRKGGMVGLTLGGRRVRLSGDYHRSSGVTNGVANAYTTGLAFNRLWPFHWDVGLRATWFDNALTSGHLETLRVGMNPAPSLHLDWSLGGRTDTDPLANPQDRRVTWYGLDADLGIGRSWYLGLSGQRESGMGITSTLFHSSLTWRF